MNDIVTEGKYAIILYAKSAPKGDWNVTEDTKAYKLRNKICKQGRMCYTSILGQCLNENQ